MIYALNTLDISEHERRVIARHIRDDQRGILRRDKKVVFVRDTRVGEGVYYCVYCMARVYKQWNQGGTISFQHVKDQGKGCIGSDKGLPGIENPYGVVMPGDPDGRSNVCNN